MVRVTRNVGRLVEGIVASPIDEAEAASAIQQVRLTVLGAPGKAICCIDATGLTLVSAAVSDAFVDLFTRDSSKIECSAFLIARRASGVGLQLDRMLRQGGHPGRRSFEDADALAAWLGSFLTSAESQRLGTFLRRSSLGQ